MCKLDICTNDSSETTNTTDIDKMMVTIYLIKLQFKPQDRIYWKVIELRTTFITIKRTAKIDFRGENYDR